MAPVVGSGAASGRPGGDNINIEVSNNNHTSAREKEEEMRLAWFEMSKSS